MRTVEVPDDALAPGDVVETMEGRFGVIALHGWDATGAFGYMLSMGRDFDRVWIYHGVVMSDKRGVWKRSP